MKVKVKTPFYHSFFGLHKAGEEFGVLSIDGIESVVEVIPEEKKETKKATTKKAKQA